MKTIKKLTVLLTLPLGLVLATTACSDDSTSAEEGCNIGLPSELLPVVLENDYFEQQNIPHEEQYSTFKEVEAIATMGNSIFVAGGPFAVGMAFLQYAQLTGVQPEFDGSTCTWTIEAPPGAVEDGEDVSVVVKGTPTGNGVQWEVEVSGTIDGQSISGFPIISGFTADDGSTGEWTLRDVESGAEVAVYDWNITAEDQFELSLNTLDGASVDYNRDGSENYVIYTDPDYSVQAYWNESTHSGWIEDQQGRRCYENFENAACS